MTSSEFEVAAKNAVLEVCRKVYAEDYNISDIQVVWFAHTLGNKKAIIIDCGKNQRMYEVTYNVEKNELYIDTYEKQLNYLVPVIDTTVHMGEQG